MTATMKPMGLAATMLSALALAACNSGMAPSGQDSGQTTANETAPSTTVTRETPATPEPAFTPMPAQTVIQSQPGPDGSQVDLVKVAVTGDILTVTLRCSGPEKINSESFAIKDISVIDDATSQRIGVLKDANGDWLASNVVGSGIMTDCTIKPGVLWAKFAAPSADAKTVSINLPKVAPFDGVPVTR